jgi:nucleotide-binding universal stress UspA family protein
MFTNIVCATDGSQHADRALQYAAQLARSEGAPLHVVHIVEQFAGPHVAGQPVRADQPAIDEKVKQQVADIRAQREGVETKLHRSGTFGGAAKPIAEIAGEAGADLIVVGTRGHSAVAGAVLGSVTQRLLSVAPCPVLAVPPPGQAPSDEEGVDEATTVN